MERLASAWKTKGGNESFEVNPHGRHEKSPYESRSLRGVQEQFDVALLKQLEIERQRGIRELRSRKRVLHWII